MMIELTENDHRRLDEIIDIILTQTIRANTAYDCTLWVSRLDDWRVGCRGHDRMR